MLEEVKKHRSKVKRLIELLDKHILKGISFEEIDELVQLLEERYKYTSSLAEKLAISSFLQSLGVVFFLATVIPEFTDMVFTGEEGGEGADADIKSYEIQ